MFFCEEYKAEFVKGFFTNVLELKCLPKINLTLIHRPYHQNMLPRFVFMFTVRFLLCFDTGAYMNWVKK